MTLMEKVNEFAANGWWQAGVIKAAEYVIVIVVGTLALHFLPPATANTVVNGLSNALGVSSTLVL